MVISGSGGTIWDILWPTYQCEICHNIVDSDDVGELTHGAYPICTSCTAISQKKLDEEGVEY